MMNLPEIRRSDYSLDEIDAEIMSMVERFFDQECDGRRGRIDLPDALDPQLWDKFLQLGIMEMAAQPRTDGGASHALLVLICEQVGRVLAPIPVIESLVVARTLAGCNSEGARQCISAIVSGHKIATMAVRPLDLEPDQLVSAGSIASLFLVMDHGKLKLVEHEPFTDVKLYGVAGYGRWAGEGDLPGLVLARGIEADGLFAEAGRLLRLLSAAAMAGLAAEATLIGADFSRTRLTRGVPIGSLQAVSFPLTQSWILANAARNLARKAAWFDDVEPDARRDLVDLASVAAVRAAKHASVTSTHVQAGFGFDTTSDISCYNRVGRVWASQIGMPERDVMPTLAGQLIGMSPPAANQRGFI